MFAGAASLAIQCARQSADLAQGERLFQIHCASCHGAKGEGARGPALAVPKLSHAPTEKSMRDVIANGIRGTEMPQTRLNSDETGHLAAWVLRLGQSPAPAVAGDAEAGRRLYFTRGNCDHCHTLNGRGGASAPDLTDIGRRRGAAYLRTALTDPEAEVPSSLIPTRSDVSIMQNFVQLSVVTKDGRKIKGVRLNEDTVSIQIRDFSDRVHSFFKSELVELHKDWGKSSMPGYRGVFSEKELLDVVAFLVSLRGDE
jgi:putative heme-binding domain-containing protein